MENEYEATYLGDSVYAKFNDGCFILYLDNGEGAYNEIILEPDMIESLTNYADSVAEQIKNKGERV
jgi:hypothetical protein